MGNKVILIVLCFFSSIQATNYPFPTHKQYVAGVIKPNNVSQADMDEAVEKLYYEWKEKYVTPRPGHPDQSYIFYNDDGDSLPKNAVSVSEGQGYGMIITAYMAGYDPDAQATFDNLFRYYQAFPSYITPSLMGWQQVLKNGEILR